MQIVSRKIGIQMLPNCKYSAYLFANVKRKHFFFFGMMYNMKL